MSSKGFEYGTFPGAGKAGENDELACFASYWCFTGRDRSVLHRRW